MKFIRYMAICSIELLLVVGWLSSYSFAQSLPNRGIQICFQKPSPNAQSMMVRVGPLGCFSSSCTRVKRAEVRKLKSTAPGVVELLADFQLVSTGSQICTRDCGGARSAGRTIELPISAAGQELVVNGQVVGQVPTVDQFFDRPICLSSQ